MKPCETPGCLAGRHQNKHNTLAHIVLMMMSKAGVRIMEACRRSHKGCGYPHAEGRPGKVAEALAFVGLRQSDDADIAGARRLTATTAAGVLGKLRREHSSTGMCGR